MGEEFKREGMLGEKRVVSERRGRRKRRCKKRCKDIKQEVERRK